jgi:acylphosphatase
MPAEPTLRSEVLFAGEVQGVGFRFTTQALARGFDVVGYVQNLPDGSVRVVVEGAKSEIDQFVGEISRRMENYIQEQNRTDGPARGEFSRFEIRR